MPRPRSHRVELLESSTPDRGTTDPLMTVLHGRSATSASDRDGNGATWKVLSTFAITSSTLEVQLSTSGANWAVVADGVRILLREPVTANPDSPASGLIDNGDAA